MNNKDNRGAFIAFEGIDGSGKSTQSALLIQKLRQEGVPCYATMEPTDAPIGSLIRQVLTGIIFPRTLTTASICRWSGS